MEREEKRIGIRRMARPKGRKYFNQSFSLTLEQIDYVKTLPNASELIRKFLDDCMRTGKEVESEFPLLSLKRRIDLLEEQRDKLLKEKDDFWVETRWGERIFEEGSGYIDKNRPKQTHEAQYLLKKLKMYDDALKALDDKIRQLKEEFMKI